ncbi:MAG: CRISPR-associated protein [Epsilonproteobacteria bacterium]|nr:CRISPR-associated protein [Campylobacterota bacterium]
MENKIDKSEIIFLYESKYSIPNGDPFTGEQRYDEETKKVLVSDVRIKRNIRNYLEKQGLQIFVTDNTEKGITDAKGMLNFLAEKTGEKDILKVLQSCIDVRLFGGISTLEKDKALTNTHVNITGPVQFALLNPSLNKSNLRIHQNTTHFSSKEGKGQGSIGTTSLVPYTLCQIQGWINPYVAEDSGLKSNDLDLMFKALWYSTNGTEYTRTKSNQHAILLLQIVYNQPNDKIYGTDRLIRMETEKQEEEIRSMQDDFTLDFKRLVEISTSGKVKEIRFFTEIEEIEKQLTSVDKFKKLLL